MDSWRRGEDAELPYPLNRTRNPQQRTREGRKTYLTWKLSSSCKAVGNMQTAGLLSWHRWASSQALLDSADEGWRLGFEKFGIDDLKFRSSGLRPN